MVEEFKVYSVDVPSLLGVPFNYIIVARNEKEAERKALEKYAIEEASFLAARERARARGKRLPPLLGQVRGVRAYRRYH